MKLCRNRIYSTIGLLVLAGPVFADGAIMAQPIPVSLPGKVYVGFFGGGGASNRFDADQYGSAFYREAAGGPLAVNAFGDINNRSAWFVGGQLGYEGREILLSPFTSWTFSPGAELEGYYIGKNSFHGDFFNNTARLPEHDFEVTLPTERSVFLTNAILTFNKPGLFVHPYLGLGIGGALVRVSGADSTQVAPPEIGVNHFNTNTHDTDPTFAAQIKLGLNFDINPWITVFAEYRWLYLSSTHFVFGSTVAPGHVETSPWQVKLDPQDTNFGGVGIRFNL